MKKFLLITIFSFSTYGANAALTLSITGTLGSSVVHYSAGGNLAISGAVVADWSDPMDLGSGAGRLPAAGKWDDGYNNNLGDILGSYDSALNDDLILSSPVTLFLNGTQMDSTPSLGTRDIGSARYDTIDLDPGSGEGDDVELDNTVDIIYDDLADGDVLSWGPVSGTFSLESGNFEDVFITEGTFTNAAGTFELTVNSVPEPSSTTLLSLVGALLVRRRRRRRR